MSAREVLWPVLRRVGRGEAAAVSRLLARCLPAPWSVGMVEASLSPRGALTLVADATAVTGELVVDLAGAILTLVVADEVQVLQVAVAPPQRRQGLGRFLLESGLAAATELGARHAWLEVREGNEAARRLYLTARFSERGRRKAYYHDGEDAIVMHRALGPLPVG